MTKCCDNCKLNTYSDPSYTFFCKHIVTANVVNMKTFCCNQWEEKEDNYQDKLYQEYIADCKANEIELSPSGAFIFAFTDFKQRIEESLEEIKENTPICWSKEAKELLKDVRKNKFSWILDNGDN